MWGDCSLLVVLMVLYVQREQLLFDVNTVSRSVLTLEEEEEEEGVMKTANLQNNKRFTTKQNACFLTG